MSIINSYFQQTVHTYVKLHIKLQHFEMRVMLMFKRVSLNVSLILNSFMPNDNSSDNTL